MKKSHYILIIGMVILIAGAIMIIARGFVRTHEKDNQNEE